MANPLAARLAEFVPNPNVIAFSRLIRFKESSEDESAYTEIYGGEHVADLSDHPFRHRAHIPLPDGQTTSASGAYQAQIGTWDDFIRECGQRDFSKESQDLFAAWCINRRHALGDVLDGLIPTAIIKCRQEWTSLPGAAESQGTWTIAKAVAKYAEFGGTVNEVASQPAAPIEDRSIKEAEIPATPTPATKESDMGTSLVTGLITTLLQSFAPLAQQKISAELGRHTDTGTADTVAQNLMTVLLNITGHPDPAAATPQEQIAAVAKVQADPALIQQAQKTMLDKLEEAAPLLDKLSAQAIAERAAQVAAMDAAARRAQGERWDMTPALVWMAGGTATAVVLVLLGAITYQGTTGEREINIGLIGIAGPIIMAAIKVWQEIFAYRFDGSKQQSETQQIALNAITKEGGAS